VNCHGQAEGPNVTAKKFVVSDGKMVLHLQPAGKGWYAVTSPLDPGITTQARSIEEAFVMAYDARKALQSSRAKLARHPAARPSKDSPPQPLGGRRKAAKS
jgi:antitoxin HicB